ncbi:MAG: hypothetical protein ACR2II_08750 [Chthoniobacterales bacterium]
MSASEKSQIGYAFALPRLVARFAGREVRSAEFSRWEAYGLGIVVFGISSLFVGRALLPLVRPGVLEWLTILLLPFALWIAFLLWYFVNAQVAALLRRLGLYTARTNNPFQHFMIMSGTTLFALLFLRDGCAWIRSLGVFWLALLLGNLLAIVILKFRHEP